MIVHIDFPKLYRGCGLKELDVFEWDESKRLLNEAYEEINKMDPPLRERASNLVNLAMGGKGRGSSFFPNRLLNEIKHNDPGFYYVLLRIFNFSGRNPMIRFTADKARVIENNIRKSYNLDQQYAYDMYTVGDFHNKPVLFPLDYELTGHENVYSHNIPRNKIDVEIRKHDIPMFEESFINSLDSGCFEGSESIRRQILENAKMLENKYPDIYEDAKELAFCSSDVFPFIIQEPNINMDIDYDKQGYKRLRIM